MEGKSRLTGLAKLSYGLGAVGKDMVYMLSASYVLYYFQDLLGVNAIAMGVILMVARVFDAFNDPIMGVVVAKTKTRWGKFRPWLLIGTLTNAVILFLMFSAPPKMDAAGLVAYAAVTYIMWGITYTMMDIPYWSMIPAFTEGGKERENLTTLARSCAGVGSAVITIVTMMLVPMLGGMFADANAGAQQIEIVGFQYFSLIVAILFVLFTVLTCINVKEKSTAEMKTVSVGQMFKALLQNDQAMTVTVTIVLINCAVYITSNLVIYFFKYDFGTTGWNDAYVLFNMFGGAIQVLSMMAFYPLLRKKLSSLQIFYVCLAMAAAGYLVLLALAFTSMSVVYLLFIPAFFIFAANGMLTVITTVFLANTVDYGELKNHRRDESVIFSMQTFVVKLASGIAALAASICLSINNLQAGTEVSEADKAVDWSLNVAQSAKVGLRMTMTVIPIIGLIVAFFWFKRKFILNDDKVAQIAERIKALHAEE
ncbi:MAG: glycoside-pentoside-hexuronide (GPH):cation symporter [Acutalibacteraceae bacterium]|jgi:melibiose permease